MTLLGALNPERMFLKETNDVLGMGGVLLPSPVLVGLTRLVLIGLV